MQEIFLSDELKFFSSFICSSEKVTVTVSYGLLPHVAVNLLVRRGNGLLKPCSNKQQVSFAAGKMFEAPMILSLTKKDNVCVACRANGACLQRKSNHTDYTEANHML